MKRIDIKGQTFGKLTVLELSDKLDASRCRMWKCRCDCGNITYASSNKLITGGKKSCGCLNPYVQQRVNTKKQEPFVDCACYRPKMKKGCYALKERLCEKKGKCSFYKQKEATP